MQDTPRHHASLTTSTAASHTIRPTLAFIPRRARSAPQDRVRRELRFWAYLGVSALCAILIPVVVVVATHLTDDGLSRALLAWLIAMFMGLAVYTAAAATHVAHRIQ